MTLVFRASARRELPWTMRNCRGRVRLRLRSLKRLSIHRGHHGGTVCRLLRAAPPTGEKGYRELNCPCGCAQFSIGERIALCSGEGKDMGNSGLRRLGVMAKTITATRLNPYLLPIHKEILSSLINFKHGSSGSGHARRGRSSGKLLPTKISSR